MLPEQAVTLLQLSLLSVIAVSIAWRLGLFAKFPERELGKIAPRFSQVLVAFLVYLGVQVLLLPILAGVWFAVTKENASIEEIISRPLVEGWLNFAGIALAFPGLIGYSLLSKAHIWEKQPLTIHQRLHDLFLGGICWLVAFPVVTLVAELFHILSRLVVEAPPLDQVAVRQLKNTYGMPLLTGASTFAIIVLVPLIEEILFRGFIQGWLRSKFPAAQAIIVTAVIFTLVHFSPSQGVANAELLAGLFILSLFLGFLYERQQSLWPCIGLHCVFNFISVSMILMGYGEG